MNKTVTIGPSWLTQLAAEPVKGFNTRLPALLVPGPDRLLNGGLRMSCPEVEGPTLSFWPRGNHGGCS